MTPERFARAKSIFLDALERPAGERAAFVGDSCAGDLEIRQEVEALLESEEKASGCLHGLLPDEARGDGAPSVAVPARVGPYTIVREIGQGGMGAVYLADRADREYRGRVALKIVPRGMDTNFILQRFRSERQILASLSHPNIARLLDGGFVELAAGDLEHGDTGHGVGDVYEGSAWGHVGRLPCQSRSSPPI